MKLISEIYRELGIAFSFPIEIIDANGRWTYYEDSNDSWAKYQYDVKGNDTYFEDSNGYWDKSEYDAKGNRTYCEDSDGLKSGTPRSTKTCEGKVVSRRNQI
jgi:hypothetical protein